MTAARRPDPAQQRRWEEVVRLAPTLTAKQISARTGTSLSMVYVICKKAGVQPRTPFTNGRRYRAQNT